MECGNLGCEKTREKWDAKNGLRKLEREKWHATHGIWKLHAKMAREKCNIYEE